MQPLEAPSLEEDDLCSCVFVDCVGHHPTHLFVADMTELIGFREHGIKRLEGTYESRIWLYRWHLRFVLSACRLHE
jgi:hypothetical protein